MLIEVKKGGGGGRQGKASEVIDVSKKESLYVW